VFSNLRRYSTELRFLKRVLIGGNIWWTILRLLVLLISTVIVSLYFFPDGEARYRPILVDGKSMNPTFVNGQTLWIHTLEYENEPPVRGDIVVLGENWESKTFYLKRIIGLPGERISIRRGEMAINGEVYDQFGVGRIKARLVPFKLEEDVYFVLGDNRPISSYGVVEVGKILGKVL
tara:strand:+ start:1174 stop:1704 length:531 start_codon:yes stop_codon:yes gene_type:complete